MRNECVDRVMDELERYGLKGEVGERGKHLEVAWVSPAGRRFIIVPKTASDWRSSLNSRSDLRKLLRADNLQPRQISEITFQKAMSLPKPVVVNREQSLQNDVDTLTDLVFELQSQMTALQDKIATMRVVSTIEYGEQIVEEVVQSQIFTERTFSDMGQIPFRSTSQQYRIAACLTSQFRPVKDIIQQSGAPIKYVYNTLCKAKKLGFAESGPILGTWRRKP